MPLLFSTRSLAVLLAVSCVPLLPCHAETPVAVKLGIVNGVGISPLFDPARHMRVADVKPGMKGYCETVFSGTKIERFDVEVVSITRNEAPGLDAVLIMCNGGSIGGINGAPSGMQHYGSVAGMSGSPVYLYDNGKDGPAHMLGAFAFGYSLAKDAIAGVTPIEYMLALADPKIDRPGSKPEGDPAAPGAKKARAHWSWSDSVPNLAGMSGRGGDSRAASSSIGLSLSASGISSATLEKLRPILSAYGIRNLNSGGGGLGLQASGGGGRPGSEFADAKIEPGSTLIIPMLSGDTEIAALGTCTEVIGDRVFAFGHPFEGEGGVELPMCAGYVNTIIATLNSSFKVGATTSMKGTLRADTATGVAGILGQPAKTIPITIHVKYSDGTVDRTFHYSAVRHPRFTPLLSMVALAASLETDRKLPANNTVTLGSTINLAGRPALKVHDTIAGGAPADVFGSLAVPLMALTENPFQRLYPDSLDIDVVVEGATRTAEIISAQAAKTSYHAGDTVGIELTYRPFREVESSRHLDFKLPVDLAPGDYQLSISDKQRFETDEVAARPDRISADNIDDLLATVREQISHRADALYVRLAGTGDGLAIRRAPLSKLPPSRRQVMENAARPSITPISISVLKVIPWAHVTAGSADLTITIEPEAGETSKSDKRPVPTPPTRKTRAPKGDSRSPSEASDGLPSEG